LAKTPGYSVWSNTGFFIGEYRVRLKPRKEFESPRCGDVQLKSSLTRLKEEFLVKKFSVLSVILVCLLAICMTACSSDGDSPKTIRITGIVSPANTKANAQVDVNAGDHSNQQGQGTVAMGDSDIVNQTLSVDLFNWTLDGGTSENRWTGDGEWCIRLKFRHSVDNHQYDYIWKNWQKCNIRDAVTELSFADFVLVWEEGK
jgi:hypothetical protein